MADFRTVPADQKKTIGVKINELKQVVTERINALKEQMEEADASSDDIDLTRTAYPVALGTPSSIDSCQESDYRHFLSHGLYPLSWPRG